MRIPSLSKFSIVAKLITGALITTLSMAARAEVGVSESEILIGQTLGLTGTMAGRAGELREGEKLYFDYINAHGGVNGRKINIIVLNDNYDPKLGIANVEQLINTEKVFALFDVAGTAVNSAILPQITQADIPLFFPSTGASVVRNPTNRQIFTLRASYAQETSKLVNYLATVHQNKIVVVYQNSAFGKDCLASLDKEMTRLGLKTTLAVPVENDGSNADQAAAKVAQADPQALILFTTGKPTVDVVHSFRHVLSATPIYTISAMGDTSSIKDLGADGIGVSVSSVVPSPWGFAPVVREYQATMAAAGNKNLSYYSLEGYLNAKVFVEAIRRTGHDLTRQKLISTMENISDLDAGGFAVSFGKQNHQGSSFVDVAVIGTNGRFTR